MNDQITDKGWAEIAKGLAVHTFPLHTLCWVELKTTVLKLPWPAHCFLCVSSQFSPPANRVFVFDFLQKNTSVKELNLGGNNIGDAGVVALAKALEVGNQLLRCLCILKMAIHMLPPPAHTLDAF